MSVDGIPIVAHGMRTFLGKTETFIGDQIVTLEKYRPIVFCYTKIDFPGYTDKPECVAATDLAPVFLHNLEIFLYEKFRIHGSVSINQMIKVLHQSRPELIHFHFLVDARFLIEAKRRLRVPAIASAYGYDVSDFTTRYFGMGYRYIRPLFNEIECFIAMSKDMRKDLIKLGCPAEKIVVHYYGINTHKFRNPDKKYDDVENVQILCCASLRVKKGQLNILQALHYAEKKNLLKRKFTLTLVGEGPQRNLIEQLITEYGWYDKVTMTGHINHNDPRLADYYREADLFCLPSFSSRHGGKEGIPGTVVEGMSAGIPIVSTYHAGIPEIITSGEEGLLVEENNIEQLAQALSSLINDVDTRRELGVKAYHRAITDLDVSMKTRELEAIYQSVTEGSIKKWIP